jgi:hypothetical protein
MRDFLSAFCRGASPGQDTGGSASRNVSEQEPWDAYPG